jgi:hypothetical protein
MHWKEGNLHTILMNCRRSLSHVFRTVLWVRHNQPVFVYHEELQVRNIAPLH